MQEPSAHPLEYWEANHHMANRQNKNSEFLPEIKRARISHLTVYDVTDSELEILERGTPDSLYLNFSISLLSCAISFTVSLLTTTVINVYIFMAFISFTIISYLGGIFLLFLWRQSRTSVTKCVDDIRKRLPPEGIQQTLEDIQEEKQV